ncbi:phytanoyl-CoA dioxygenase family protein [Cellvibrio sp. OA-2007]|uniref:phytanoyl-CoA dioxygenase family protein n=1 Tax=Cellvibrio sp. OA-2007 TaxID=529823 RepID=UPI000A518020|nr:phytanoyl-CoA dioxygenase family protein [Cellvibrio sp. OA-2007]
MQFFEDGCEIVKDFISENWRSTILNEIEASAVSTEVGGVRNINRKLKTVAEYLNSIEFKEKACAFIPASAQLVRAILFNKSPQSNWFVTWHQDKTVAVSSKFEEPGWGAWSVKENTLHVQPPLAVLEGMVTIRIHLDSTPKENGCLKVIPNSYKLGILNPDQINEVVASEKAHYCEAEKCAALIMRPHLLHASSKSSEPSNRRVLHFEFSNWKLPSAVCWG